MKIEAAIINTETRAITYIRTTDNRVWANGQGDIGILAELKLNGTTMEDLIQGRF